MESKNSNQFVTFNICDESYGISVFHVQEVLNYISMTRVPNSLSFMKGVIDLRGKIIPLIDMRIKFGQDEREYDFHSVIIIVNCREYIFGLVVDSVSDVIHLSNDDIQHTPHFTKDIKTDSVTGIARLKDSLVIILDVNRLFTDEEMELLKEKSDTNKSKQAS